MTNTNLDLIISLDAGTDVTKENLDRLTRQVQKDLVSIGSDVRRAQGGETLIGEKGILVDINTLVVTLASAGVLTAIIQLLKDWVLRAEGRKIKIRTEIGGKIIEFEYSPTAISEEELMAFAEKLMQMLNKQKAKRSTRK